MASLKNNIVTNYLRTSYQELSRVAWPTRETATKHAIMVIVGCLLVAAFFGIIDFMFNYALQLFISRF